MYSILAIRRDNVATTSGQRRDNVVTENVKKQVTGSAGHMFYASHTGIDIGSGSDNESIEPQDCAELRSVK
jgi:hypothetical protein